LWIVKTQPGKFLCAPNILSGCVFIGNGRPRWVALSLTVFFQGGGRIGRSNGIGDCVAGLKRGRFRTRRAWILRYATCPHARSGLFGLSFGFPEPLTIGLRQVGVIRIGKSESLLDHFEIYKH
jgi:hypothetical protein